MDAAFTPGPWVVCKDSAYVDGADGKPVAYCRDPERQPSDMTANAKLIAAAPDMFEALVQYRDDLLRPPVGDSLDRRLRRVDELLAKARGK